MYELRKSYKVFFILIILVHFHLIYHFNEDKYKEIPNLRPKYEVFHIVKKILHILSSFNNVYHKISSVNVSSFMSYCVNYDVRVTFI